MMTNSDPEGHIFLSYPHTNNIRIYHGCEGRIEKAVTSMAVWHHEAHRVMTSGDPEGQMFPSYPYMNNEFFSRHCFYYFFFFIFIYSKISFKKSMDTLILHDDVT